MLVVWTQMAYLVLSLGMTVYVAYALHSRGRIFLVRMFGDDQLADSVNHLLVVGFYLVNFGFVFLWTKYGVKPETLATALEFTTTKVGVVMLAVGAMHFFNLMLFWKVGRHRGTWRAIPNA